MKKSFQNFVLIKIKRNNQRYRLLYAITNIFLLNFSFFLIYYLKRNTFNLSYDYLKLLISFNFILLFISLITRKFRLDNYNNYLDGLLLHIKSIIFITYLISLSVVILGLSSFSRIQVFGTCVIFSILDILLFSITYLGSDKYDQQNIFKHVGIHKTRVSIFLLVGDFLLISFAFFFLNFYKRGSFNLSAEYEKILLLIYGLWLITSIITQKFSVQNFKNYYYALAACTKSVVLMGLSMSLIIFALRLFYFSRLHIFGTLLLLIIFEIIIYYFYFILQNRKDVSRDIESIEEVKDFFGQTKLSIENKEEGNEPCSSFIKILRDRYLISNPQIYNFVQDTLNLAEFKDTETAIMRSSDIFNIKILDENKIRLLINLYRINDIRWINRYFLSLHENLINGAYIIGTVDTIYSHKKQFFNKYPKYIAEGLYVFHFIFYRIFPKMPKLRKIYFSITKGKNRMISRAELLGRLYFCGFNVLAEKGINGSLYFIAKKVKTPSIDQNPSYGPIIKLKRVGLNGQPVEVYKLRTMYPYAEYLQEYIYNQQKLDKGGKIKEDFRVTDWGKFMRKYWLDELPMLYNWIKGDIKLLGVRPLSKHYLSLYDSYLQKIRKKIKPGLIPPYYADLPKNLKEIRESERRYIQAYCVSPFKTQFIYFWKVFNNIIFRGARSG